MTNEEGATPQPGQGEGADLNDQSTDQGQPTAEGAVDPRDAKIAELESERDSLKDAMLRAMAEAQTIRRRMQEQMANERKYASEGLVVNLLPVLDNFERTLAALEKGANPEKIAEGVASIHKQMMKALEDAHVHRIKAVGHSFDPAEHEALVTVETDEHPEDTVTDELEAGYRLYDRVIRPARVRVSKKP